MSRPSEGREADRLVAGAGELDEEDADCDWCPTLNAREALWRLPDPRYDITAFSALCEYHLAVLKREHELHWRDLLEHPEFDGLDGDRAEHVLVESGDVPDEVPIDGTLYQRLGLDDLGQAYFVAELGGGDLRIVVTDERFDVQDATVVARGRLRAWIDRIGGRCGWRGIESDWLDRADEWDDRVRSLIDEDDGGDDA